jgi:hypothetical protein
MLSLSEPKIATHNVAAKYPAGDGDAAAAAAETQLQTLKALPTDRAEIDLVRRSRGARRAED